MATGNPYMTFSTREVLQCFTDVNKQDLAASPLFQRFQRKSELEHFFREHLPKFKFQSADESLRFFCDDKVVTQMQKVIQSKLNDAEKEKRVSEIISHWQYLLAMHVSIRHYVQKISKFEDEALDQVMENDHAVLQIMSIIHDGNENKKKRALEVARSALLPHTASVFE